MSKRIGTTVGRHLRSNLIGYLALFVALTGSAYAAAKVGTKDIRVNAVTANQIHAGAVGASEIRKNAVKSPDVKDGGLRPKDIRGLDDALKDVNGLKAALGGAGGLLGQLSARIAALETKNGNLTGQLGDLQGQITSLLDGLGLGSLADLSTLDLRLDAVCSQLDGLTNKVGSLKAVLVGLPVIGAILDPLLAGISIPDFNQNLCQG